MVKISVARLGPIVAVVAALTLVACAEEEPTEFTDDNRSGFLAACSQPLDDSRLVNQICQCVFDETQSAIPFAEFSEIDAALIENPDSALPAEITQIISDCVVEEADI